MIPEGYNDPSSRPCEPLTSDNAALVLVDHQVGLMTGLRDYSTGELKHNMVALAKAATVLKLSIIVTTTARDRMWRLAVPQLVEALPGIEIIDHFSVNAFDDAGVARAIQATDRKKLILRASLSKSVPPFQPSGMGWNLSALWGSSARQSARSASCRRTPAGVILSDDTTSLREILKDDARPEAWAALGQVGGTIAQANGK
jgi:hypothetical protein